MVVQPAQCLLCHSMPGNIPSSFQALSVPAMDSVSASWVKGAKQSGFPFLFLFKFLPRSPQELEVAPFFLVHRDACY